MKDDIAISVNGVSKSFKLPHEKTSSLKGALINWYKKGRGYEVQHVLKDVSFQIKKGEFFGIVGRNGSGKSTLLKLISQIYTPDKGSITVNGKLTPFIELGVGFNPELSGRDNVYLNGALLGFSHTEVDAMYSDIVEFAEIERFMDQKLKNYSSGMQVRLAFSIAIRAQSDILLLDEVLAVGDEAFQQKCFNYFEEVKRSRKTIILVTHDMSIVEKYCDRAVLVNDGILALEGTPVKAASAYRDVLSRQEERRLTTQNSKKINNDGGTSNKVSVMGLRVIDESGRSKALIKPNEKLIIECSIAATEDIGEVVVTIRCDQPRGEKILFAVSTKRKKLPIVINKGQTKTLVWEVENTLNDGKYILGASVFSQDLKHNYDEALEAYEFEVRGSEWPHSLMWLNDEIYLTGDTNKTRRKA